MHEKFEIDWTKIKGGCQSGRKVVTHNCKGDLPLVSDVEYGDCSERISAAALWFLKKGGKSEVGICPE